MATDDLEEEYKKIVEDKRRYQQLISQQKDQLVFLNKEIFAAECKNQETSAVVRHRGKYRRYKKEVRRLDNLFKQGTVKLNELMCSNMDCRKNIDYLLQQKVKAHHINQKLNQLLAVNKNMLEKLQANYAVFSQHKTNAETHMQKMSKNIKEETVEFVAQKMKLETVIQRDSKLCTFMDRKLQEIILSEDEAAKKRRKPDQLEIYRQWSDSLEEATGESDPSKIGIMFMENKRTIFSLMNYITELSYRRNMLKNRTDQMKSDIMFLERTDEQSTNLMKDLELDLENSSRLADSLEEQLSVAQTTLDQLQVAISGLLDEIQENVTVTSDNMTHFICFLENIRNGIVEEQQELQMANFDLLPAIKCSNRNSALKVSDSESSVDKERSKPSTASSSTC